MRYRQLLLWCVMVIAVFGLPKSHAESFPDQPIRIIVPYSAGGIADVLARVVGAEFEKIFKQPVVVENKPGANGTIAQQAVADAKPNGYTLLLGNTSTQVINRFLYKKLAFNLETAFEPVGKIAFTPMLLVVAADSPYNSVSDVLGAAKDKSKALNFGSAGIGAASHLALVMFTSMGNVEIAHIPYKGTANIRPDIMGGRLSGYFDVPATALGLINSGKLKAIGIASKTRQPVLPNVPAIAETIEGFEIGSWLGLFAPAGTPKDRIALLNKALNQVLAEPRVKNQLVSQGNEVLPTTPQEFATFISKEAVRLAALTQKAGIQAK